MSTITEYRYEDGEPVTDPNYWRSKAHSVGHYHAKYDPIGFKYMSRKYRLQAVIGHSGQRCHITGEFVPMDIAECDHIQPAFEGEPRQFSDGKIILFNRDGTPWHHLDNIRIAHPDAHKVRTSKQSKQLVSRGHFHLQTERGRSESSARARERNALCNPNYTHQSYGLTVAIQKLCGTGNHTQKEVANMLHCGTATITRAMKRDLADYAKKCGVDLGEQNDKVARIEFDADDELSTGGLRVQSDATNYASV